MIREILAAAALGLVPIGASGASAAIPLSSRAWDVDFSRGVPAHPLPAARGWSLEFPGRPGHLNYVSMRPGPLLGARQVEVRFRVEAAPGTRFVARESPGEPATISLYLQRRGDRMTRPYANYRWYAPAPTVVTLSPGEHRITVPLDDRWTSVLGRPASANPRAFRAALEDSARIGLVFGTRRARGHGVYATGPARITVTSFRIV